MSFTKGICGCCRELRPLKISNGLSCQGIARDQDFKEINRFIIEDEKGLR